MSRDMLQFRTVPGGGRVCILPSSIEAIMEHENGHTVIVTSSDTYQVAESFEDVTALARAVLVGGEDR